ncbi:MAG: GNAT family N-acetyltransferase [Rhizobiales bacterium]|nr:GNAT family N-acetyltransferase [Hyphomicrobiales bacterium]MBI3674568.1 GNAT family N-acetyltransferase [Hyphomicrobiales bacterium]
MSKRDIRPVGAMVDPLPVGNKPDMRPLHGRWMWLEPVSADKHGHALYESFADSDPKGQVWTYLGYGPWPSYEPFEEWLRARQASRDPWFYAFIRRDNGKAVGMGSFMRCDAPNGVIEIGHIWMSPGLQKTREATEAIYLMIRHCFDDLGVRRLEWKCDALNGPSRRAAERFGFTFEGIFRQHMIVKGRNRDTAWYAMLDHDWHRVRAGFEAWLSPKNFDAKGHQKAKLQVA